LTGLLLPDILIQMLKWPCIAAITCLLPLAMASPAKDIEKAQKAQAKADAAAEKQRIKEQPKIEKASAKLQEQRAIAEAKAAKQRERAQPKIDAAAAKQQREESRAARKGHGAEQSRLANARAALNERRARAEADATKAIAKQAPKIESASTKLAAEQSALDSRINRIYSKAHLSPAAPSQTTAGNGSSSGDFSRTAGSAFYTRSTEIKPSPGSLVKMKESYLKVFVTHPPPYGPAPSQPAVNPPPATGHASAPSTSGHVGSATAAR
jgi:hypothetical protein